MDDNGYATTGKSVVLSPSELAGTSFVCSQSTIFWGITPDIGTVFNTNVVASDSLSKTNNFYNFNGQLKNYFLISDFSYRDLKNNKYSDWPCIDNEKTDENALSLMFKTQASVTLHD